MTAETGPAILTPMKIAAINATPVRVPRPRAFTSSPGGALDPEKTARYRIDP